MRLGQTRTIDTIAELHKVADRMETVMLMQEAPDRTEVQRWRQRIDEIIAGEIPPMGNHIVRGGGD